MIDMLELTVKKISALLDSGEITSYQLVQNYLERVAKIDQSGPMLNSIIEINPDALYIASAMDRERQQGKKRSALHGVPIVIKDNINTHDKLRTTAGSIALADNFAPYDATVTKKLRDAGLIIMGKTNMTELANYMSYTMNNGYSSRGGQVVNAYYPEGTVWGSSSGSAVAMSANLCALAIGTETDGSIIWPSYANSTVGIKPTRGLVSRHGIVPICTGQDTAGPMARTVADCAALLNIIVGEDEFDPSTWALADRIPEDYTAFLQENGLKGMRVGVNRGYYDELNADQIRLFENAIEAIRTCGAEIVEGVDMPRARCDSDVLLYEFKKCMNAYLSTVNTKCRTLKDMIDYYGDHPKEGLKYGMTILLDAEYNTNGNCTEPRYLLNRMAALQKTRTEGLDRILDGHDLDVYVSPAESDFSPISGYPSIAVPAGYESTNMPFAIVFIGRPFSEPQLIKAAYSYEQATHMRKTPKWGTLE